MPRLVLLTRLAFSVLIGSGVAVCSAEDKIDVTQYSSKAVIAGIREREAKVKGARFAWKEKVFEVKGGRYDPDRDGRLPDGQLGSIMPPEDMTYAQKQSYSFSGEKYNIFAMCRVTNLSTGEISRTQTKMTYDGNTKRWLRMPNQNQPQFEGRVYSQQSKDFPGFYAELMPIPYCYCLGEETLSRIHLDDYSLELSTSEIDGVTCLVLYGTSYATTEFGWTPNGII